MQKSILMRAICLGCLANQSISLNSFADEAVSSTAKEAVSKSSSENAPKSYPLPLHPLGFPNRENNEIGTIRREIELDCDQAAAAYREGDYSRVRQILLQTPAKLEQYQQQTKLNSSVSNLPELLFWGPSDRPLEEIDWVDTEFTQIVELLADSYFLSGDYDQAERLYGQALTRRAAGKSVKRSFSLANVAVAPEVLLHSYEQFLQDDYQRFSKSVPAVLKAQYGANYHSASLNDATEDLHNVAIISDLEKHFTNADKMYEVFLPDLQKHRIGRSFGMQRLDRPSQMEKMGALNNEIISLIEKEKGPESLSIATRLDLLAAWYLNGHDKSRTQARAALSRAIAIKEKSFGKDSPKLMGDIEQLVDLSAGTRSNGDIWARRSLELKEKSLGADSPDLLPLLERCAQSARANGNRVDADTFLRRILAIKEKQDRPDSPELTTKLKQLAQSCEGQGKLHEAETLYQRIIAIRKQDSANEKSDDLVRDMNSLAGLQGKQGLYPAQRSTLLEALDIQEKTNGNTGLTNAILDQLAFIAKRSGDMKEAESLLRKALLHCQQTSGMYSVEAQAQTDMLITLQRSEGKFARSEPLLKWKVDCMEHVYGVNSQNLVSALNELSDCYQQQGKYNDAENSTRKALDILEQSEFKSPGWLCLNQMCTLASILTLEKKNTEAIEMYKTALKLAEQEFELHNQVPRVSAKLAKLYRLEGKIKEADAVESRLGGAPKNDDAKLDR